MSKNQRTIKHDDMLFLIAMAEKGVVWMGFYGQKGAKKAQERLIELKRATTAERRENT